MRELDELLLGYLENHYEDADEAEKAAFRDVLALSDPELNSYLFKRQQPPAEGVTRVIERILGRTPR